MKYVYIAGPYMGAGKKHDHTEYHEIDRNITKARECATELAKAGIGFFCPHTHSAHFEVFVPEAPPTFWYELDIEFLKGASAILLLPGWENSTGSKKELEIAQEMGLPVYYWFNLRVRDLATLDYIKESFDVA